ncbi:MAG TPA: DNA-directed DNA polymerase [Candidatus Nanoarchaeia archaeon]|nr:DNA-directed DNA polymerase [Candidatus Nanoarchaeia archaeon]
MRFTAYPYDFEYKLEQDQVYVYSYCKLSDGQKAIIKQRHDVFFYAAVDNIDREKFKDRLTNLTVSHASNTARVLKHEPVLLELNGKIKPFFKIYANYPQAVPVLAKQIQDWGVECFEKDILFIHRYLRDVNLVPMAEVEVEGDFDHRTKIITAKTIRPSSNQSSTALTKAWKILALDIETYSTKNEVDPQKNPILMVGLYGPDFEKVITWKKFDTEDPCIEFVADEKELLEKTAYYIRQVDPEILAGYFSDGFDLPYINTRCAITKADFKIGHSRLIVRTSSAGKTSEVKLNGIIHLDIYRFIRYIFGLDLKVESFSLDTISEKLLGQKKLSVNLDQLSLAWDNNQPELEQFCRYNLHDAKLTHLLSEKLLPEMMEFVAITGLPLFDVTRMRFSRLVESYILKKAAGKKIIAPNRPADAEITERMNKSIQGGFVYEPQPGLYNDLVVFDFRSLYPSIISSHNLGPESLNCNCCTATAANLVPGKPYWFCQKHRAFLPSLLEELISRRIEIKKQIKLAAGQEKAVLEAQSYALKILANSFYGYLGFYGSRWYSLESADSTTAYARHYIQDTMLKAQQNGFELVYGDTDSLFIQLNGQTVAAAAAFMDKINLCLPGKMELNLEGYFPRGIFVSVKGQDKGAKKKYALLRDDGSIKITGFEMVRRNSSALAKEAQQAVLSLVLRDQGKQALWYVRSVVKDLKKGLTPLEKLVIKTQITRELSKYKVVGPHLHVARRMIAQGQPVTLGMVVKYIVSRGSGLVRERAKLPHEIKEGEYDYDYYINHQLIPAVSGILATAGYTEEEIFKESSQQGLKGFM